LSIIKAEIERYMSGPAMEGMRLTSHFAFPPVFIGFQGHFPEKKILPGICQIQCALSTLEKGSGRAVVLKEVMVVKYFSPVFPDDEVTCIVNDMGDTSGEAVVRVVISKKADKVSEMKLRVSYAGGVKDDQVAKAGQ
jgi:3-hydroxyacyl-[acyl-carrier-protein] dehydratase